MRPVSAPIPFLLLLSGCEIFVGGRVDSCGEPPPDGRGPAVIATLDQELCDVVRLRVIRRLDGMEELKRADLDRLVDRTLAWEQKRTLDELVEAIRKDAGDAMAEEVQRAASAVLAQSRRTTRPECGEVQRCLVKGAAKGARIALLVAQR